MSEHIFISYSHKDKDAVWFEELIDQLRSFDLPLWIDSDIQSGRFWRDEIKNAIKQAEIYILIITPSFMASEFIQEHELPCIKEYKDQRMIIPILAKRCAYKEKFPWLGEVQLAGGHGEPLEKLGNQLNDHLTKLVIELKTLMTEKKKKSKPAPETETKPSTKKSNTNQAAVTCSDNIECDILPYLADRSEAIQGMIWSLSQFKEKHPGKPLVWIIHGNDSQCHIQLINCIEKWYWQNYLYSGSYEKAGLKKVRMHPLPYQYEVEQWQYPVAINLRNQLKIQKESPSDIFNKINQICNESRPILLYDVINTSEWIKYGKMTLYQKFMDFWNQWPGTQSQNPLIVCLLVKYTPYVQPKWKRFFGKSKKDPNEEFKNSILNQNVKSHCAIIPELTNINQKEVEDWHDLYSDHIERYCPHEDVSTCIEEIFEQNKDLPMKNLVAEMNKKIFNTSNENRSPK